MKSCTETIYKAGIHCIPPTLQRVRALHNYLFVPVADKLKYLHGRVSILPQISLPRRALNPICICIAFCAAYCALWGVIIYTLETRKQERQQFRAALAQAVTNQQTEEIKRLIRSSPHLVPYTQSGIIAKYGDRATVKMLLLKQRFCSDDYAKLLIQAITNYNTEAVDVLIEELKKPGYIDSYICAVISEALIQSPHDLYAPQLLAFNPNLKSSYGAPLFHIITHENRAHLSLALIQEGSFDPNLPDGEGRSPLEYVTLRSYTKSTPLELIARTLLQRPRLIMDDRMRYAVLSWFRVFDYRRLFQHVSTLGEFDINQPIGGLHRNTLLHKAVQTLNFEAVQVLVEHGANVHARNIHGETPLDLVGRAHHPNNLSSYLIIDYLIKHGADPATAQRPLRAAIIAGNENIVRQLLEYHVELPDALQLSILNNRLALTELFLNRRSDTDTPIPWPNFRARREVIPGMIRLLLRYGADPFQTDDNGNTPFHRALYARSSVASEFLEGERNDLDLTLANRDDDTFLHLAAREGNDAVVTLLLERLDPHEITTQNQLGNTALHEAVRSGAYGVVEKLLEVAAADAEGLVNTANHAGESPLFLAVRRGNMMMAKILIKAGADKGEVQRVIFALPDSDPNKARYRDVLHALHQNRQPKGAR